MRAADLMAPPLARRCSKCAEVKPLSLFRKQSGCRQDLRPDCIDCMNAKNKAYRKTPEGRRVVRDVMYRSLLKERYGMALEDYEAMLEAQDHKCAICRRPEQTKRVRGDGSPRRLSVDHDHETGAVRALLCNACNNVIARAEESPETLEAAAQYIRRHRHY